MTSVRDVAGRFRASSWLLLPFAVGAALRCWQLSSQILSGDEIYALTAMLRLDLPELLWTYERTDHSPPIAALFELLSSLGVPISESVVRVPALLAGLLALVVLPLGVERLHGRRAGLLSAWLLAVSPWAVLWSRIARSYMPIALLASGAALCVLFAFERRSGRWLRAGALLSFLAVWLHLVALPFVLGLWCAVSCVMFSERTDGSRFTRRQVVGAFALWITPLLLLCGFGWNAIQQNVLPKAAEVPQSSVPWGAVGIYLAGVSSVWVALGIGLVAASGVVQLGRSQGRRAAILVAPVVIQIAAIALAAPKGSDEPMIAARYLFVGVPLLLTFVAIGVGGFLDERRPLLAELAGPLSALLLVAFGPLLQLLGDNPSFAHVWRRLAWLESVADSSPRWSAEIGRQVEGTDTVVLAVRNLNWRSLSAYAAIPELRERRVIVALRHRVVDDGRLSLENAIRLDAGVLASRGAVHLLADLQALEREDTLAREQRARRGLPRAPVELVPELERRFGTPDLSDERWALWKLEPSPREVGGAAR